MKLKKAMKKIAMVQLYIRPPEINILFQERFRDNVQIITFGIDWAPKNEGEWLEIKEPRLSVY